MSQSEDAYAPEEPTPDIPMSLLDIQMPETPDSTKGQTSDGDTSRLESPKILKPVLGKLKAKKRLMAFANKFNVPSKVQNKSNLLQAHSTKISKSKSMSSDNGKSSKNDSVVNVNSDSVQYHSRHSSGGKSKKKTGNVQTNYNLVIPCVNFFFFFFNMETFPLCRGEDTGY